MLCGPSDEGHLVSVVSRQQTAVFREFRLYRLTLQKQAGIKKRTSLQMSSNVVYRSVL